MTLPNDKAERLFTGQIAAEYGILKLICPAAEEMSSRVGAFVAGLPNDGGRPLEVLEIGCGTGATTLALLEARPDLKVTALDNEPAMLAEAHARLKSHIDDGRLALVEADALSALRTCASGSIDVVASAYAIHNFLGPYRTKVLAEIFRVLAGAGHFVNGDRYARDDSAEQTRLTQAEARHYFKVLGELKRYDLLEQWILHLFSDESADHLMPLGTALTAMREIGFDPVEVRFREGVNTLLAAAKPPAEL
jgi:ubiquinone/menaquinone biosynthesis C-methylase UbiE